jgi:hypothetical protein
MSAQLTKKIGRIAQLGERCPYKAEVTGSIPVPPTRVVGAARGEGLQHRTSIDSRTWPTAIYRLVVPIFRHT